MPVVQIHMLHGHSLAEKRRLVKTVTAAIASSLGVPKEYVNIILSEMAPENNGVAGRLIKDIEKPKTRRRI